MIPPTLHHVGTAAKATTVFENETLNLYAADAGAEYGIAWLKTTATLPDETSPVAGPFTPSPLNGCNIQVLVEWIGPEAYQITSTAIDDRGRPTTITAKVHMANDTSLMLDYGIYALGTGNLSDPDPVLDIRGSAKVYADVYANGKAYIQYDPANPNVDAYVYGDITYGCENSGDCASLDAHPSTVGPNSGPIYPLEPPSFPIDATVSTMTTAIYDDTIFGGYSFAIGNGDPIQVVDIEPCSGSLHIIGDLVLNPKPGGSSITITFPGDLYVEGNIENGGGGSQGDVRIIFGGNVYVTGALTTTQQVTTLLEPSATNSENPPMFITDGDMEISGDSAIDALVAEQPDITDYPLITSRHGNITTKGSSALEGVFYAPMGNVDMRSGASLYGVMIAQTFQLGGSNELRYPPNMHSWGNIDSSNPRDPMIKEWTIN